ncbi:hypothetical protein SEA_MAIH_50 [Streptomyces phage Maih]|uniref:Uncharacterized protein n=5 Tax=Woodruffvirus TP1604 TaxID=1982746 RepID=A0A1P8VW54_9CAUD|nr:hypothetical protein AVT62_gp51 [Streptomyces phage TP1604]ALY07300.1 hypothetical protein SEA_MAIH_50 [Streptomyces phage Maih]APZ82220.1 hypothetical protein SEA_BABYGOTBAC_52 [Streptomyces phage BabyGotBac]AWN08411.1 hypothetical protein SEA_BAYC_51 [Streptomyces phage BayC]AWN08481.1 hypothetical protein SEA_SALETE_51 [Streptomyces phage Salete]USH45426.1 hypothetical protein SEA_ASIS_51 [Streptomyces phage Asis]
MKIQVILRTAGQPDAVVGESEGETMDEVVEHTAQLFDELAETMRKGEAL